MADFAVLQKALNSYINQEGSKKLLHASIKKNIKAMTVRNFHQIADTLVRCIEMLLDEKNTDIYLHTIFARLQSISAAHKDFGFSAQREKWHNLYRLFYSNQPTGENFSLAKTQVYYYFFKYKINQVFQDDFLINGSLLRFLLNNVTLPDAHLVEFLDEDNLLHAIKIAVIDEVESKNLLEPLLCKFDPLRDLPLARKLFESTMSFVLKYGQVRHIQLLFDRNIPLPEDITQVGFLLSNALACKNDTVFRKIVSHYGKQSVMDYALLVGHYPLVVALLRRKACLPEDINTIKKVFEIASYCGDIKALRNLLKNVDAAMQHTLYQDVILPCYRPETTEPPQLEGTKTQKHNVQFYGQQAIFCQQSERIKRIVSYHMEKGLFTLSLEEEKNNVELLGPKRLGELRASIGYQQGSPRHYLFGLLREDGLSFLTTRWAAKYEQYFDATDLTVLYKGHPRTLPTNHPDQATMSVMGDISKEYQVKLDLDEAAPNVPVTKYTAISADIAQFISSDSTWFHTNPQSFPIIRNCLNALWQQFCEELQADDRNVEALVKHLAHIHFLNAVATFYFRGSAANAEFISAGGFDLLGLDFAKPQELIDCIAIISQTKEEFLEKFPGLMGCKSYADIANNMPLATPNPSLLEYKLYVELKFDTAAKQAYKEGISTFKSDNWPQSIEHFQQALAHYPEGFCHKDIATIHHALGAAFEKIDDRDQATIHYEAAINIHGILQEDDGTPNAHYAKCLMKRGLIEKDHNLARELLGKVVAMYEHFPNCEAQMGIIRSRMESLAPAP